MKTAVSRTLVITITLVSILLLGGCSQRFSYGFLDWWLAWQIREHVSLNRSQWQLTRQELNRLHHWHQKTQLAAYASYLEHSLTTLNDIPVSPANLDTVFDQAWQLSQLSLAQLVTPLSNLLETLSDRQVNELLRNIERSQQRWYRQHRSDDPEQQQRLAIRFLENHTARWIGPMTQEQRQWTNDWAGRLQPVHTQSLAFQQAWIQRFKAALEKRHQRLPLEQALSDLLLHAHQLYSAADQRVLAQNRQMTLQLMARISNNLSEKQKQFRQQQFEQLQADFLALAAKAQQE